MSLHRIIPINKYTLVCVGLFLTLYEVYFEKRNLTQNTRGQEYLWFMTLPLLKGLGIRFVPYYTTNSVVFILYQDLWSTTHIGIHCMI